MSFRANPYFKNQEPVWNAAGIQNIPVVQNGTPNVGDSFIYNGSYWVYGVGTTGPIGSLGPTGAQGIPGTAANTGATGPTGVQGPIGNFLRVDAVYGNDVLGAANPYSVPFKTIGAALTAASSGQTVFVFPGTYNEALTMKSGVALRGTNIQTVIIQKTNVVADTTLLTMASQCRVEDVTLNLSSAANVNLVGIDLPSGTSTSSKIRVIVLNVTSSGTGGNVYGIQSAGTSATGFSTSSTIRGSTINVITSNTGTVSRGVIVNGPNRFSARDTIISASGPTGSNIVGVETTNAGAFAEIKTSTVNGTLYDINQSTGVIQLSATDLINSNANGNGFSTATNASCVFYGITKNITNDTAYLLPGTSDWANRETTPIGISFPQRLIVYQATFGFGVPLTSAQTAVIHIHKNTTASTPFINVTLNGTSTYPTYITNLSQTFNKGDTIIFQLTTSGNIGNNVFYASLGTY